MNETMQGIIEMIQNQREWSWSVIGIAYVVITLMVRSAFLSPLIKTTKELKRSNYNEVKDGYIKKALKGWLFYIVSLVLVIVVWNRSDKMPLSSTHSAMLAGAAVCFGFAILFHVQAVAAAALSVLKRVEIERA